MLTNSLNGCCATLFLSVSVSGRPYPIVQNQVQPPPFPKQPSYLKKIIMREFSKSEHGDFQSLSMAIFKVWAWGFSKLEHGDFQSLSMGIFKAWAWGFSKFEHGDFQPVSSHFSDWATVTIVTELHGFNFCFNMCETNTRWNAKLIDLIQVCQNYRSSFHRKKPWAPGQQLKLHCCRKFRVLTEGWFGAETESTSQIFLVWWQLDA